MDVDEIEMVSHEPNKYKIHLKNGKVFEKTTYSSTKVVKAFADYVNSNKRKRDDEVTYEKERRHVRICLSRSRDEMDAVEIVFAKKDEKSK